MPEAHDNSHYVDVGQQQVAKIYAKALLGAAHEAGQVEPVLEQVGSLVDDVLDRFPRFGEVLASQLISEDDKDSLLDRVFSGRAVPLVLNFLKVLAAHGRLDCLRAIRRSLVEQYNQMRGRIAVQVATATPLESSLVAKLTERLAAMLGGEPQLELITRPELIGGIVLQVGDTVYDGSVATQLARAREQMIRRSIHEIQSGRDRFSNSEGN